MRFVEILRLLRGFVKIPALENEKELREFLARVADALASLAAYTPTTMDDLGIAVLRAIIANDATWQAFYRLLKFAHGADDIPALVAATGLTEEQILALRDAIYDQANPHSLAGFGGPVA